MKIWAHRGCSQRYPENTITAFSRALELAGLTGIELDVQLTRDGKLVVIHDERVDRTTTGSGWVRDYSLAELKALDIKTIDGTKEKIPTLAEVLELVKPYTDVHRGGTLINIELKNSIVHYENLEEKTIALVDSYGMLDSIVWSSFYTRSCEKIGRLLPGAEIGILDEYASDCLYKHRGGAGGTALHPFWRNIDLTREELAGLPVRAWLTGHLYPEPPTGTRLDFAPLAAQGITDLFLNEPEVYLKKRLS